MRPSATSGRKCWHNVSPASATVARAAGAPYIPGGRRGGAPLGVHPIRALGGKCFLRQRVKARKHDVIGGCARGELGQHVSLAANGHGDARRTGHGQIAGDLERADRAAGNQDALTTKAVGIRILIGVRNSARTGERCQPGHVGQRPALEGARRDDDVRELPFG